MAEGGNLQDGVGTIICKNAPANEKRAASMRPSVISLVKGVGFEGTNGGGIDRASN